MSHAIHRVLRLHRLSTPHVYSRNGRRHSSILHIRHHNHCHPNRNQSVQLTGNSSRRNNQMRSTNAVSSRIHLPLHYWWTNRNCPSKLLPRHCPTRHLLRSSSLPLRTIHRSSICNPSRIYPLIPTIHRIHPTLYMS